MPASAAGVPRVDLWQGVQSGMSVSEVAALRPDARPVTAGDTLVSGFEERLRIAPFDLDGEPYEVKFFFDATVLRSVLLTREDGKSDVAATTRACDARIARLDKDFGEAVEKGTQFAGLFPLNRNYRFRKGDREALLLCLGGPGTSIVNVAYQPHAPEPTSGEGPPEGATGGFFHPLGR
jgi:hypothetical protein